MRAMRVGAYYTIEATYIMAILLFIVVFIISYAIKKRDEVLIGYATHEAAQWSSHIEETWDYDGDNDIDIEEYFEKRLSGIGARSDGVYHMDKDAVAIGISDIGEIEITIKEHNPEKFMRFTTLFEGLMKGSNSHEEDEE